MAKLQDLPGELLSKIFAHLSRIDKCKCLYVSRAFNRRAIPFVYDHLYIRDFPNLAACEALLTNTALNRDDPNRQSEYSNRNYGQYITSIKLCPTASPEQLLSIARHCPDLVEFEMGQYGLNPSYPIDDDFLVRLQQYCPKLRHIDFHGSKLCLDVLNDRTQELCRQLVSLNLVRCQQLSNISSSLAFSSLTKLTFQVRTHQEVELLHKLMSTARNTITTLGLCWLAVLIADEPINDISQLLLDCPNLKTLALEWKWDNAFTATRFPPHLDHLQLIGAPHNSPDHIMEALLKVSNLKRLYIQYFKIPEDQLKKILDANSDTLEALTYYMFSEEPVNESCLRSCKNLKSLSINPIKPEKGDGKLGKFISRNYRCQLETLYYAYDEPCFWSAKWPNVKCLMAKMKRRHTTTKAGIERLANAFPNVEYLQILYHDKGNVSAEEWKELISRFQHLKGLHLQNSYISFANEFYTSPYCKSLACAYEEWESRPKDVSNFVYPTQCLLAYDSLS